MTRPQAEVHRRPAEGAALLERLARHALRADDRGLLVQVVRWLCWRLVVVQEATRSLKRRRTLGCGQPSTPPTEEVSESVAVVGEGERGRGAEPVAAPAEARPAAPRPEAPRHQER